MNKISLRLSSWSVAIGSIAVVFLAACGEDVTNENITQVVQDNLMIVSSTKELPKCTKDNEGAEAFVKGETSERICIDGKWTALASSKKDTVVVKDTVIVKDKSSCTTKELKDKSGVKIVCNGDSVGVVLNGKDGATGAAGKDGKNGTNGKNGAGCTVETLADNSGLKIVCGGDSVGVVLNGEKGEKGDPGKQGEKGDTGATGKNGSGCTMTQDSKKITITCGDKSSTINLSDIGSSITPDTTVVDSEKVAVSLDSLTGYTQKGPFIKGSTVYLYELMDGRTLKQTNGSFTSNITRDDGRFKFTARDLVSQYVMLVVDGNYRNEVTGKTSNSAIRLKAYSDVRRHATGTVNVNILTHLEFDRVYYLVTREKMTMKKAKQQAQEEIRKLFYIELSDKTDAEDLDVFGTSEADAALLAISILLQGNRTEPEMMALLTEISTDIAEDGKWNETGVDSIKAEIAIWAMTNHRRMSTYKSNVKSWGLGDVPPFEKYIDAFIQKALGFEENCTPKNEGEKVVVKNKYSPYNGKTYVCTNENWTEIHAEKTQFNPNIKYGAMVDSRDHKIYKTVDIGTQTWMAENLDFTDTLSYPALKTGMKCFDNKQENCEKYGRLYTYKVAIDTALTYSDGAKDCVTGADTNRCAYSYPVRGICPEGWHLPNGDEIRLLWMNVGSTKAIMSKETDVGTDDYGFSAIYTGYYSGSFPTMIDYVMFWEVAYMGISGLAFYVSNNDVVNLSENYLVSGKGTVHWSGSSYLFPIRCLKDKEFDYGILIDKRDNHQYKTIKIGKKTWMAENLNYKPVNVPDTSNFCLNDDQTNCDKYGRYYTEESLQGVCPQNWHLPDSTEWYDAFVAHGKSVQAMQSTSMYATNTLGLAILPMTPYDKQKGFLDIAARNGSYVWRDGGYVYLGHGPCSNLPEVNIYSHSGKCNGCPVRCVQD